MQPIKRPKTNKTRSSKSPMETDTKRQTARMSSTVLKSKEPKPKPIHYSTLLFGKEGGVDGVRTLLVAAVRKERATKFDASEIDTICGLGNETPKSSKRLPSWAQIEKDSTLMTGFIFSLVTSLFDIRADSVLRIPQRVKNLSCGDYKSIVAEMETNGFGVIAAAGGNDLESIATDRQVVPYVVTRIFEEV